ncbi:ABC transporter ATP-binding protein [Paenibacillus methanolicus]|uniref:Nickel transport system ATP-binding protein n=1 Tax=Paenibacillus methanolicus TaxID=582686 RepID=A0A5S5CEH0_9BACL|nr:ABC transporter ATP-binding protein [Paenibacillus methanolicus]TYP76413.1 nickel transport system ATP-binding protein [Paenibacillus methanolicus]
MLSVEGVEKFYKKGGLFARDIQHVLKNISFSCGDGECLGIIGESGSGKSTLGRLLLGIEQPARGTIRFDGANVMDRGARSGRISAVFQDYTSSMNPFFRVEEVIKEPLRLRKIGHQAVQDKIDQLLHQVGLNSTYRKKYPHELSGGEAQRVSLARAVATEPKLIVLDEAISSLDGSVQIQVLDLLRSLRQLYNMSYIFITHDIQAAAYLCDSVLIIRDGQIEEMAKIEQLKNVQSAYAKKLLRMIMT